MILHAIVMPGFNIHLYLVAASFVHIQAPCRPAVLDSLQFPRHKCLSMTVPPQITTVIN